MPIDPNKIIAMAKDAFPGDEVKLIDMAGDNNHFMLEVISASFEGKSRIAQHKMVYDAMKGKVGEEIHALSVKTKIPE